jgi:hypothetical protein
MAIEYQETDRERAIRAVLYALRSPLVLMIVPDREAASALAVYHAITAADLLDCATRLARRT